MYQEPRKKGRSELPHQQKLHIWADAAIPILQEVASEYDGYITYGDLAKRVVNKTNRTTAMPERRWIGDVLGKVLQRCRKRSLPALPSLVVQAETGMVGMGFNYWLELTKQAQQEDQFVLDAFAAPERFKCYQKYAVKIPEGAKAGPTPLYWDKQNRSRRATSYPVSKSGAQCASCGMTLPITGQCDACE